MEQDLISKKELLELTGISYGQLYRWKRKDLIPEEWFIRKSTYTGQETFFPRQKILERIDKILNKREGQSLDDLADLLSPHPAEIALYKQELLQRNVVSAMSLDFLVEHLGDSDIFPFDKILFAYVLEHMLRTGEMSLGEGEILLQTLRDQYHHFAGKSCELIFIRKMGVSVFLLHDSKSEICFESGIRIVVRLGISDCVEELKNKLL